MWIKANWAYPPLRLRLPIRRPGGLWKRKPLPMAHSHIRDPNNPFDSNDGFSNALLGTFDTYTEQTGPREKGHSAQNLRRIHPGQLARIEAAHTRHRFEVHFAASGLRPQRAGSCPFRSLSLRPRQVSHAVWPIHSPPHSAAITCPAPTQRSHFRPQSAGPSPPAIAYPTWPPGVSASNTNSLPTASQSRLFRQPRLSPFEQRHQCP